MKLTIPNIINYILNYINNIDIPRFLYCEVESTLPFLNFYKLKNVYENIEKFWDYLIEISKNYMNEVEDLLFNKIENEK